MSTAAVLVASICGAAAIGPNRASANPVLLNHTASLTTFVPDAQTRVQRVQPRHGQRAAYIDGSVQMPSALGMSLAAAPGNDLGWNAKGRGPGNVMLADGSVLITEVDLGKLKAPGNSGWMVSRSYNSRQEHNGTALNSLGYQGVNRMQDSQPEIVTYTHPSDPTEDMVIVVTGAGAQSAFKRTGSSSNVFRGVNGAAGVVYYEADGTDGDTYTYYDAIGTRWIFWGFNGPTGNAAGNLWKKTDPAGNVAYVGSTTKSTANDTGVGYDSSGRILLAVDGANNAYFYTYTGSYLTKVEVKVDVGGTWTATGYKVEYTYYGASESYGLDGDLKTVTVTTPLSDAGQYDVETTYYRYWTSPHSDPTNPGHPHLIQYIVSGPGYARADYAGDATFDGDPLTMTESSLKPHAAVYYEYDASRRVSKVWTNGDCGCGGGAADGATTFEYETNPNFSPSSGYDQEWYSRTTENTPGNAWKVTYSDETSQINMVVVSDSDPDSATNFWPVYVERNTAGQLIARYTTAAVATYYHNDNPPLFAAGDVLVAFGGALNETFVRWDNTAGAAEGFVRSTQHSDGVSSTGYDTRTDYVSATLTVGGYTYARVFPDTHRIYRAEGAGENATGSYDQTDYDYTFWSGSAALMPKVITINHPVVTAANNGSDSATISRRYMRPDGTVAFTESAGGIFTYSKYSDGKLVLSIHDVDTDDATDIDTANDDPSSVYSISENNNGAHRKTVYTYDSQDRLDTITASDGLVTKHYHSVLADRRHVTLSFPRYEAGSPAKLYGPATYTVTNQAGKVEASATIAYSGGWTTTATTGLIDETSANVKAAVLVGSLFKLTTSHYNETGTKLQERRAYFDLASVPGTSANYDATTFLYNDAGQTMSTTAPDQTKTRTYYDGIDRFSSTKVGTNDNGEPGGAASGANNMVKTREVVYDAGGVGNGHITKDTAFVQDSTTGRRDTTYIRDYRGRVIVTIPGDDKDVAVFKLNNVGQQLAVGRYSSSSGLTAASDPTSVTTNRLALTEYAIDNLGRPFKTTLHSIAANGSSTDTVVTDEKTFDADGRLVKQIGQHITKYAYDHQGRPRITSIVCDCNDSTYGDADDVIGDKVLEEHHTVYESDVSDNVVMTATIGRYHDELSTTGALDTNADNSIQLFTMANVRGFIQVEGNWHDHLNRLTTHANYGTNGGSNFNRSGLSEPSASSSTVMVTKTAYNDDGTVKETTNVHGRKTSYAYDPMGRMIRQTVNDVATPSGPDQDVITLFEFDDGHMTKRADDLDRSGTINAGDGVTIYAYGVPKGASVPDSKIAHNGLLHTVQYPDSSGSPDIVTYAYNAQGQPIYMQDQAGTTHEYTYDLAGRKTDDGVSAFGSNIDQRVDRISWAYDGLGRISTVTQYDDKDPGEGNALDQVLYGYSEWDGGGGGLITSIRQDHNSAVDASGSVDDQGISYTYAKATPTNGGRCIRLATETLPNGSVKTYFYQTNHHADNRISRITSVRLGATTEATYAYCGLSMLVKTDYPVPGVSCSRLQSVKYDRLDRWGRVLGDVWTGGPGAVDFFDTTIVYGTNPSDVGNIVRVEDNVLGNGSGFDVAYTYDQLDRLLTADEGTWSGGSLTSRTRVEHWTLDQLGNWTAFDRDLDGGSTPDYSAAGEYKAIGRYNLANEWLDTSPGVYDREVDHNNNGVYTDGGDQQFEHSYDAAGNMTSDGEHDLTFDAWNRLVEVAAAGGSTKAEFTYNGLGWRTSFHDDADLSGTTSTADAKYDLFYDRHWRLVAVQRWPWDATDSRFEPESGFKEQFLFHEAGNPDTLILRQKDANAWTDAASGTLSKLAYYQHNWRGDTVVLVDDAPIVLERARYTPYGVGRAIKSGDTNSDFSYDLTDENALKAGTSSGACADVDLDGDLDSDDAKEAGGYGVISLGQLSVQENRHGYAGYEHDHNLGDALGHVRNRAMSLVRGTWITRDPAGNIDGRNLYAYARNSPVLYSDTMGLWSTIAPGTINCVSQCYASFPQGTFDLLRCLRACSGRETPPPREATCFEFDVGCAWRGNFDACLQCCKEGDGAPAGCIGSCINYCRVLYQPKPVRPSPGGGQPGIRPGPGGGFVGPSTQPVPGRDGCPGGTWHQSATTDEACKEITGHGLTCQFGGSGPYNCRCISCSGTTSFGSRCHPSYDNVRREHVCG